MFNKHDLTRDEYMLKGRFAAKGYDWWWHNFTGINRETGEEKQFFIEYYLCNPSRAGSNPVYGQLEDNKRRGIKPSYMMVKAGCWGDNAKQLHRFFTWNEVSIKRDAPFKIMAADCTVSDSVLNGSVSVSKKMAEKHPEYMSDDGKMEWRLKVHKQVAFNVGYGAGKLLRELRAFEMYWHAEGMKSTYSGEVILDGEVYDVLPYSSFGYADKNWGCDYTSPWLWVASSCMKSRITGKNLTNSAIDIGGGRPKVFGFPLEKKLLGAFWYEGMEYEYNFTKFWMMPGTRFEVKEYNDYVMWKIWQENYNSLIKVDVRCRKSEMILVNYESPDGEKMHNRLWNGGNGAGRVRLYAKTKSGLRMIDDIDMTHVGCEYGEADL